MTPTEPDTPHIQTSQAQELSRWVAECMAQRISAKAAAGIELQPLRAEASFRQFYRVVTTQPRSPQAGRPAVVTGGIVLMVSPPERENNDRFTALIPVFRGAGVRVPELLASRAESGWFLLEDLGTTDLEQAYAGPHRQAAITDALTTLARIQSIDHPLITAYTPQRFRDELEIFRQWFVTELLALPIPDPVEPTFEPLLSRINAQDRCCVHRDYHCRNLLYDPQRGLGVVDFQDALRGPIAYDLASLLHDCYYEFPAEEIAHWREQFRQTVVPDLTPARFHADVDYCAVQRQLKAIGIFSRLHCTRGIGSHLAHIEPVLGHLVALCVRYPELILLGRWLESIQPLVEARLASLT